MANERETEDVAAKKKTPKKSSIIASETQIRLNLLWSLSYLLVFHTDSSAQVWLWRMRGTKRTGRAGGGLYVPLPTRCIVRGSHSGSRDQWWRFRQQMMGTHARSNKNHFTTQWHHLVMLYTLILVYLHFFSLFYLFVSDNFSFLFALTCGVGVIWMAFTGFQRSTSRRNDCWKRNVTVEIIKLHAEWKLFLHAWKQRQQHSIGAASSKQEASASDPVSFTCSPCSCQGSCHKRDSQVLVSSR